MTNAKNVILKRSLEVIATVLADSEDELLLLEQENQLLTRAVYDQSQSNLAYIGILSHIFGPRTKIARRAVVEHDDSFCKEEVPKLSLETFQSLFGVSRKTVQTLMERLGNENANFPTKFRVPLEKRILMMLWILSNQESFRSVGERFGMMAPGNVHYVFYSMCDSVCSLTRSEVCWPDSLKQNSLAVKLMEKFTIPNTLGVLGCIYIAIKCPDKSEQYYDHKGVPSICLQAVCDHRLSFLDIYTGKPGSYSPAKVFHHSPLRGKLDFIVNSELTLLAGLEYPTTPKLNLVNKTIRSPKTSALNLISLAFTKLRNTFQRLKYIEMQRPESTVKLIQTACTLHNLVINDNDEDEDNDNDDIGKCSVDFELSTASEASSSHAE